MELIAIKTRILQPPKDDLFAVLDEYVNDVQEGDVVLISSKIVAIGEGRCVPMEGSDKQALSAAEADVTIPRDYWPSPMTIKYHTFIGWAGIDESNANNYYVLLPEDCFASAEQIHTYLKNRFDLTEVGVVITDSHSNPFRYGATGVALGWWGVAPIESHVGEKDLFDRAMKGEKSNVIDGLAAAANLVMGEVAECQPIAIARNIPGVSFVAGDTRDQLLTPFSDDTFRILYERFLP